MLKKGENQEANTLMNWIEEGCFEALERHYLKCMNIMILADPSQADSIIESYAFNFEYKARECNITLPNGSTFKKVRSKEEVKKSTITMLRSILILVQTLDPLPPRRFLQIRLEYFDETPEDYEPKWFKANSEFCNLGHVTLKVGETITPFYGVKLGFKTDFQKFKDKDECAEISQAKQDEFQNTLLESMSKGDDDSLTVNHDMLVEENSRFMPIDCTEKVRCVCKSITFDDQMLRCKYCHAVQHGVCYGRLDEHPIEHCCTECYRVNDEKWDTIPVFYTEQPISQRIQALQRRGLYVFYISKSEKITSKNFASLLGVGKKHADALLKRLINNGFITRNKGRNSGASRVAEIFDDPKFLENFNLKICNLESESQFGDFASPQLEDSFLITQESAPKSEPSHKRHFLDIDKSYEQLPISNSQPDPYEAKRKKSSVSEDSLVI